MSGIIARQELLSAIESVASEVDGAPTQDQMRKHGPYSLSPYYRVFESWNAALEEAGFEPNRPKRISSEQLLDDLRSFAEEIGKTPTAGEMDTFGPHARKTYSNRFGSWNAAVSVAGLKINQQRSRQE